MNGEARTFLSIAAAALLFAAGVSCDSAHMVGAVLGTGGRGSGTGDASAGGSGGVGSGSDGGGGGAGFGGNVGSGGSRGSGGVSGGAGAIGSGGNEGSGGRGGAAAAAGSGGRAGTGGAGTGGAGTGGTATGTGGTATGTGGAATGTGGTVTGAGGVGSGGRGGAGGEPLCFRPGDCPAGFICDEGQRFCGLSGILGVCRATPTSCPTTGTPICACGQITYANDCERLMAGQTRFEHTGSCTAGAGGAGGGPARAQTCTQPNVPGSCPPGLNCLCYQSGPSQNTCYCTTTCSGAGDCGDPTRPRCGGCAPPSLQCLPVEAPEECCNCDCAAPDTPIATPDGERAIASLRPGDLVLSVDGGRLVPVPILRTGRVRQVDHHVVEVWLDNGARLEISEGHPTADGRTFADLAPGERLGGARVVAVRSIPYRHAYTHDILPASDSGTYLAGGALIGSTLTGR
jgi:hypothetical protein